MDAAIVRPPNTVYTKSIRVYWENSPKIVKITLLQFYFKFSHGNFFHYMIFTIFSKLFIEGKNNY